jgi:predicted cupin superfamily sugar epimerase
MTPEEVAERFGLEPLPVEGGWFRQVWRSPPAAPAPDGTAIVAMLTAAPDGFSQFHCLAVDELWHFYLGDPLELVLLEPGGASRHIILGPDVLAGQEVLVVVPAGVWMAARTLGTWSLFGNTMAPGFTSDAYSGAEPEALLAGWPHEAEAIVALTRPGSPTEMPPGL